MDLKTVFSIQQLVHKPCSFIQNELHNYTYLQSQMNVKVVVSTRQI